MSKFLTISVVLEFSEDVSSKEHIDLISKNVAQAIANEVNVGEGIAPSDANFYTKVIYTSSPTTNKEFIVKIV